MKYQKSQYLRFNDDFSITNFYSERRYYFSDDCNRGIYYNLLNMPNTVTHEYLINKGFDTKYLIEKKFIFSKSENVFKFSFIRYASIEILSYCNSRCIFCPVSEYSLPKQIMNAKLFRTIISQLLELPTIRWVSLNHYNEPLLHPNISELIIMIKDAGFKVRLFTNGKYLKPSFFTQDIINCLDLVVFNIPSIDPGFYAECTNTRMPDGFISDISSILDLGFPVEICVNGEAGRALAEKDSIDKCFNISNKKHCHSYVNNTNNRAGLIHNAYVNMGQIFQGSLHGCRRFFESISLAVNGDLFLCCQDYFRRYIFGNICETSIRELLTSDKYLIIKRKICGDLPTTNDFICRSCNEAIREINEEPSEVQMNEVLNVK